MNNSPPLIQLKNRKQPIQLQDVNVTELARRFEGKLLLRNEIPIEQPLFNKLLTYHFITPIQSIQKTLFTTTCVRCNNNKPSLFAELPCSRCKQQHVYCRKCIHMGRVMECEHLYYWSGNSYDWIHHENPCTWTGQLTEAQQNAALTITETIKHGGEKLIWAVTGAGKTEMIFPGIAVALKRGKRVCIATPRADVVRELLPRLQQAFTSIHIQALFSGSKDNDGTAQLIIATTHQLLRYQHAFDVLIIDEIDAFPFHSDQSLQFAANRAKKEKSTLIYLTATPRNKLQKRIKNKTIDYVFVPIRFHGYPLPLPEMIYCSSLNHKLATNTLPIKLCNWLMSKTNSNRQILLFVPTIQLATALRNPLITFLIENKLITKQNQIISVHAEDEDREEKIALFRNQQVHVLITTTILERGVTFPAIDVIVLQADHIVFDEAALVQISGRAGRSSIDPTGKVIFFHEGKTDAMVAARESMNQMNKRGEKWGIKGNWVKL